VPRWLAAARARRGPGKSSILVLCTYETS
jgi:hypothetical protein